MCEKNSSTVSTNCKSGTGTGLNATFSLSYLNRSGSSNSASSLHPTAYLYGSHPEDSVEMKDESYEKRMKRFKLTHQKSLQKRVSQLMSTTQEPESTNDVDVKTLNCGQPFKNESLKVTPVESMEHLLNVDHQGVCILCQEDKASVILNPCQHCLFCKKCVTNGFGQKFCPVCRTSITSFTAASYMKIVRPR